MSPQESDIIVFKTLKTVRKKENGDHLNETQVPNSKYIYFLP